jgi:hypothetical protein
MTWWRLPPVCASVVLLAGQLLVCGPASAEAEQEPAKRTHHLGVLLGSGIASYREDLIVPLSFDGPAFFLGAHYTSQTEQRCLQIRLRFSAAVLENRYSHKAYAAGIELRPTWTKRLTGQGGGGQLWGGFGLPLQMTNLFIDSWDDSHLYWLTVHSLAAVLEYRSVIGPLGESSLSIELPVVGFVSRPPAYRHEKQEALNHWTYHFSGPNKSLRFEGLWEFQSPLVQIMIRRGSQGSLLRVGLELQLDHATEPEDIWGINTRIVATYQWRIG